LVSPPIAFHASPQRRLDALVSNQAFDRSVDQRETKKFFPKLLRGNADEDRRNEADCLTGASFGIVPMVNTWNYFTAYMVVSPNSKFSSIPRRRNSTDPNLNQLFGLFVGIFLLGIPIYFLNPKVRRNLQTELPRLAQLTQIIVEVYDRSQGGLVVYCRLCDLGPVLAHVSLIMSIISMHHADEMMTQRRPKERKIASNARNKLTQISSPVNLEIIHSVY
jgi:hypothetical protein